MAEPEPPDSEQITPDIDLNLTEGSAFELQEVLFDEGKTFSKDRAAAGIANKIVYIFAGALLFSFLLITTVIILGLCRPNEVTTIIVPSLGGNLLEIIKVIGTIFGPLLAFILGYYFNKDSDS